VSDKKQIVIKDACILFDLVDLNLLGDFFQLGFIALTTPQVIGEITNETQWQEISKFVNDGHLQIDNTGEYEAVQKLYDEHPGLSIPDSSVLELALRKHAIIYSSDGSLRKISVKQGLTVRGILWIIEELHITGALSKVQAVEKLNLYEIINQRAPIKEIKKLIEKIK
jgi:predicted nucleic acid-binding protein